jgi:hypothetical protein
MGPFVLFVHQLQVCRTSCQAFNDVCEHQINFEANAPIRATGFSTPLCDAVYGDDGTKASFDIFGEGYPTPHHAHLN